MARSGQKDGQSRQTDDQSTEGEAALPWPRLLSFTIDIHRHPSTRAIACVVQVSEGLSLFRLISTPELNPTAGA